MVTLAQVLGASVGLLPILPSYGLPEYLIDRHERPAQVANAGAVLWRPGDGTFSAHDLALKAAPVLWFSPNEPLLDRGEPIPQSLPGSPRVRTVYYSVRYVRHRRPGTDELRLVHDCTRAAACFWSEPPATEGHFVGLLNDIQFRYFFYYPEDFGLGRHLHDVESAEITITQEVIDGERLLRITKIAASAHGQGWYANELRIENAEDAVVLPIHLLVEEGKHASVPDRNADGWYNPGYDVSHYPNDAWGVRDTVITERLGGVRYAAHLSKPRSENGKVWPDTTAEESSYSLVHVANSSWCLENGKLRRPSTWHPTPEDEPEALLGLLSGKEFCLKTEQVRPPRRLFEPRPYSEAPENLNLKVRFEGGRKMIVVAYADPGIPFLGGSRVWLLDGWLVPRLVVGLGSESAPLIAPAGEIDGLPILRSRRSDPARVRLEFMYTPSATRVLDWYLSLGVELQKQEIFVDENGLTVSIPDRLEDAFDVPDPLANHLVAEGGATLRIPVPDWFFITVRAGIQTDQFESLNTLRMVFSVGIGGF